MSRSRLDQYFETAKPKTETRKEEEIQPKPLVETMPEQRTHLKRDFEAPPDLPPSYFVSATYDGNRGKALIKLYEPKSKRIFFWLDNTGHKPYLLTNLSPMELEKIDQVVHHQGFDHFEMVEKYDPLLDREVKLTRVVTRDPLAVGGRPQGTLRDIIPQQWERMGMEQTAKVWEASIKYYQNYIYDRQLAPGMIYKVEKGRLVPVKDDDAESSISRIQGLFTNEPEEFLQPIENWARLLEYPVPEFRRVALDIEVETPTTIIEGKPTFRMPDPRDADHQVICASLADSEGVKRVHLLRRTGLREGTVKIPADVILIYHNTERELLQGIFDALWDYPFVITFNGDDFDLHYLHNRAEKLGLRHGDVPIELGRKTCLLEYGVHIDLYKFFFNRSIQIYAFGQKYKDVTLDDIGKALVGMRKIELTNALNDLTYSELAQYCLQDAEIALKLTTFDDDLVMKLILAITRISRMPMEDVSRQGVSRWIRDFLQFEHRRLGMLIPNTEDILAVKGKTATKAIIKGKKYKGAIVVEPVPGVHFNVAVMDFPSLYPSLIKVYNLGYQSILCPHEECKSNKIPGTPHWVCTKQKALESLLIGSLRDLRVKWYKSRAKDKTLPSELRSWYNVIQAALKVILNASYGVFGAETFDLYCPPVAEATAALGRHSITQIINEAQKLQIQVIYGDTDSIFLKNPSQNQINALAKWSETELHMELDVDKVYRYAVFSSRKKNYLGVTSEGTVDVKGLTGKKKHIPSLIKDSFDLMKNRLSQVKTPGDFEDAKKEIQSIIRDSYLQLKRREWKRIEDLAFNVVLGEAPEHYNKTVPQHVRAAKILQEKKYELKAGDLISFVKIVKSPHVKPVQLASSSEVDVDKYVGYLQSTFDQVLDALGLDFNEIIGLTKLERFM